MICLVHHQAALVLAVVLQDLVADQAQAVLVPVHVLAQVHQVHLVLLVLLLVELKQKQSKVYYLIFNNISMECNSVLCKKRNFYTYY